MQLWPEPALGKAPSFVSIFTHHHWNLQPASDQQWLVPELLRQPARIHQHHSPALATVTSREDVEFNASGLQQLPEQHHKWSLARPAGREISHADHGSVEAPGPQPPAVVERIARPHGNSVDAGKWIQSLRAARAEAGRESPFPATRRCNASSVRDV